MRKLISISLALTVLTALAERQPYERYQPIVDRQMFGPPPANFDPNVTPDKVAKTKSKADQELTKEQEQIKKAIRFSVLNVTPSGEITVGFTDSGDPKNPLHYYLKVGESQNGWTVKEADKDEATMTVVKKDENTGDEIEVTLRLGADSATEAGAVNRVSSATATASAQPPLSGGRATIFGGAQSMRERRRLREEQIRADEAAKHAASDAKREAADKERAAREEEEKKAREAEREEQRKQLLQIQEELRKAREAREAGENKAEKGPEAESGDTQ